MYHTTIYLILLSTFGQGIQMTKRADDRDERQMFAECLRTGQANSVMACAGLTALNKLQSLHGEQSVMLVDGVELINDEPQLTRGIPNFLDRDPTDFGGIFDAVGTALAQRTMHWDMSTIYPGLGLRLGPSYGTTGVLEFVLDPIRETIGSVKETGSTARILTRQLLVPFLLGFKFNTVSLVPIIFGLLALIAKKALVLSKLALVISSAFGLGSLLFGSGGGGAYGGYGQHQPTFGFGGNPGSHIHYSDRFTAHPGGSGGHFHHHYKGDSIELLKSSPPDPLPTGTAYTDTVYRGHVNGNNAGSSIHDDELTLAGRLEGLYTTRSGEKKKNGSKSGRNFAWNDTENKTS